jgi:hypothetical protein
MIACTCKAHRQQHSKAQGFADSNLVSVQGSGSLRAPGKAQRTGQKGCGRLTFFASTSSPTLKVSRGYTVPCNLLGCELKEEALETEPPPCPRLRPPLEALIAPFPCSMAVQCYHCCAPSSVHSKDMVA